MDNGEVGLGLVRPFPVYDVNENAQTTMSAWSRQILWKATVLDRHHALSLQRMGQRFILVEHKLPAIRTCER